MKSDSTLVVVADGGTARFFTWPKRGAPLTEHEGLRMDVSPSEGERGPSPRVQESIGRHRHRVEQRLSAHEAHENKFLAEVAGRVETLMAQFSRSSLVLCAPPKALGLLRPAIAKNTAGYEILTVDKDLTKETSAELERRMRELPGLRA